MLRALDRELLAKAAIAVPITIKTSQARPLSESQHLRRRAAEAWFALPTGLKEGWVGWAEKFRRYSPAKNRIVRPTPRTLYIKTAMDRWRLDPDMPTPLHAPETSFSGDEIGVFVIPPTRRDPGPNGCVQFASTGPNRPGVLTALLLQRLSSAGKSLSKPSLRAADFVAFGEGASFNLPVEPGHYAAAYRFVHEESLQMSPILEAGRVSVGIKRRRARKTAKHADAPVRVAVNLARFAKLDVM